MSLITLNLQLKDRLVCNRIQQYAAYRKGNTAHIKTVKSQIHNLAAHFTQLEKEDLSLKSVEGKKD